MWVLLGPGGLGSPSEKVKVKTGNNGFGRLTMLSLMPTLPIGEAERAMVQMGASVQFWLNWESAGNGTKLIAMTLTIVARALVPFAKSA